jgi:hypothetical protein
LLFVNPDETHVLIKAKTDLKFIGIAKRIREKIKKMSDRNTFKYQELDIRRDEYSGTIKAIERFIKKWSSEMIFDRIILQI